MNLNNIIVPQDVKPKAMVTCVVEGILEESDLRELAMTAIDAAAARPEEEDDPSDLKKVREKHHSVARMIANGLTQRMVSKLCGYTEGYISVLLNSPAMQELVELYRIQNGAAAQVITEKLKTVGLKAVEKLEQKLEADELNNQDLLGMAKLGLDRGGHGPTSTQHNVNEAHVIDHARLQELNDNARTRNAGLIVRREDVRQAIALPAPKADDAER